MRLVAAFLIVLALTACSDDDDAPRAAGVTTTTAVSLPTTSTTAAPACDGATPKAADGSPAPVVGTAGDVTVAIVDHGASVDVVSLFKGCDLDPVTLDGAAAAFPIGGTVTHGDGLRCDGDRFVHLAATSDDGATYHAVATTYELDGTTLVVVDTQASTIEAHENPDALGAYYDLDCDER